MLTVIIIVAGTEDNTLTLFSKRTDECDKRVKQRQDWTTQRWTDQ